jgi:hypothetical protein
MGRLLTAGDLVARMEMTQGMRLDEAKAHVAGKLGVSSADLLNGARWPSTTLDGRLMRMTLSLGGAT